MFSAKISRIILSDACAGAGKLAMTLGLMAALRKQGLSVSCCLSGESWRRAQLFTRLSGRSARVLDQAILNPEHLRFALCQASLGSDVVIVEGHQLTQQEGEGAAGQSSDAYLAALTGTPIVLVADFSLEPTLAFGLMADILSRPGTPPIAGILANRVPDAFDVELLRNRLRDGGLPPLLGAVPEDPRLSGFPSAELPQRAGSVSLPPTFLAEAGGLIDRCVDFEALLGVASKAEQIQADGDAAQTAGRTCRFAVSDDICFNVSYPDNIDLLRLAGAWIVPFSPVADSKLPQQIDGIYLTNAFLHEYGADLARNEHMQRAIRQFADSGGVVYSEAAGSAYLCRSFQLEPGGERFQGAGTIPAEAVAAQDGQAYCFLADLVDDSVLGMTGVPVRGRKLGEWSLGAALVGAVGRLPTAMRIHTPSGGALLEGYSASAQSFNTFELLHFGASPEVARALVEAAQVVQRARTRASRRD